MDTIFHNAIAGRPSRRQALIASGLTLLAFSHLGGTALAAAGDQEPWRFCDKCFAMFFAGGGTKGKCPADGGEHHAQGLLFAPHYDDATPAQPSVQYNWRFCSKCFAMFYNGSAQGRCPSGGVHVAQGFNFGLNHAAPAPPSSQTEWRFCQQCFALFYNGGSSKGRCPAGIEHVAQGFIFNLPFRSGEAIAPGSPLDVLAYDNNSIRFPKGIAADGNAHVKLHRDGHVEFTAHFHDSGATDYYYSITWAIYASDGTIFTLHHRDKVIGHITGGQADRNNNFNGDTMDADVAQHWTALTRANTARVSAHVATSLDGLLDTAKQAVDAVIEAATIYGEAYQTAGTVLSIPFL